LTHSARPWYAAGAAYPVVEQVVCREQYGQEIARFSVRDLLP
jgi:hypothetical protein